MLLFPLEIDPVWVDRDEAPTLYYGPEDDRTPGSTVALPYDDKAPTYFSCRQQFDPQGVSWSIWDDETWPILFSGSVGPDLVASSFFWLAGWQEHVNADRDEHGRFPYEASLQAHWDLAMRPVVDAYRTRLADQLAASGIACTLRKWGDQAWAFCPTHDIDYLKKWRPGILYREVVLYALLNRGDRPIPRRLGRLRRVVSAWLRGRDPFRRARSRLYDATAGQGGTGTFFLKGGVTSERDVACPLDDPLLQKEITTLKKANFEIGLHPSYNAHDEVRHMKKERDRLQSVTGLAPVSVRQHYLRHRMPVTACLQERLDFEIDTTLGFSGHEGFRHATCLPFQLFDIPENRALSLWEMPLALMDTTLFTHRGLNGEEAQRVTRTLANVCRKYGGVFVGLWHNTAWDPFDHPLNGPHFLDALDVAREQEARVRSLQQALEDWQQG